jgi:hypothetical protein
VKAAKSRRSFFASSLRSASEARIPFPCSFVFSGESVDVGADQDASFGQRVGHAFDRQPGAVVVDEVDRMAKVFVEREVTEFARRPRAVEVVGPAKVRDAPDMDALAVVAREPAGLRDRAGQGGDHEDRGSPAAVRTDDPRLSLGEVLDHPAERAVVRRIH